MKRESEWRALGLEPKRDRNGNYKPIIKKGLYFVFHKKVRLNAIVAEAIATGKKLTRNPDSVLFLVRQGCKYDDFVPLPKDVVAYCECRNAEDRGDLEAALEHIRKAFEAKSDEVTYANAFFEVRLRSGDKSTVADELAFFREDIDSLVHSGRVYEWLKYLSSMEDYSGLKNTIRSIDERLDALVRGQARNRRYTPQGVDFYADKKEQFMNKTAQLRRRLEAASAKQQGV